jgi:hypothetical protein
MNVSQVDHPPDGALGQFPSGVTRKKGDVAVRAFSSTRESVFLCLLACCALVCGSANLAAQPASVAQKPTAVSSAQLQPSDAAGPLTMNERAVELAAVAAGRSAAEGPGDTVRNRTRIIVFGAILGATVGATVIGDAVNGGIDFPESALPVAGPFIALARYDDVVTNPYYQGRTTDKVLFWGSGIIQSVSLVMIIASLRGGDSRAARNLKKVPLVSLVPIGGRGFVLTCQHRF